MPLWQHKRRPTPPPRPAPRTTPAEFSDRLMDAILHDNVNEARQVFEKAFWEKAGFQADGYHLLHAVRRDNRDMIRLLTTHGASWDDGQTRVARLIAGPEHWAKAEGELRRAGIRTRFTEADLKDIDAVAATAWAVRSVEEAERRGTADAAKTRADLERVVAAGVALTMLRGETDKAIDLFISGMRAGDGTAAKPLDAGRVFSELAALQPGRARLAFEFLDALAARGFAVQPIAPTGTTVWLNPAIPAELDRRGLFSGAQADLRMNMLRNWAFVQSKIDTGAGIVELDEKFVEAQHKALRSAAEVLFRRAGPATPAEADAFVAIHEARAAQTPHALARMEQELLEIGFFDSPSFSVKHLKRLAETAPSGKDFKAENLAGQFNRRASARMMAGQGAESFLSASKFHEIEAAHRLGAYKASPSETVKILDYLAGQVKKDVVPETIVTAVKTLRDGGANFSAVNPNRYLGKRAPGLCKVLLDLGIVTSAQIDIDRIAARNDNELRPLTPRDAPAWPDQEFMCQILLEAAAPEKYIPLRGEADVSYQQQFLREYTSGRLLKRRFMKPGARSTGPR